MGLFFKTRKYKIKVIDDSYSLLKNDHVIKCIHKSSITIMLPLASSLPGHVYIIKDANGSAFYNNINFSMFGDDMIDSKKYFALCSDYASIMLVSDGINNWMKIG